MCKTKNRSRKLKNDKSRQNLTKKYNMKRNLLFLVAFILFGLTTSAQVNLEDGLAAHYPFCGSANDLSGNENNGNVNGATLTTDRFGNANSAYSFDGVDDWIEILHNSTIDFSVTDEYSISLWFKVSEMTSQGEILCKWISSTDAYPYKIGYNGEASPNEIFASRYIGGTPQDLTRMQVVLSTDINDEFHNLIVIYKEENIKLYIDNILVEEVLNYMDEGDVSNTSNLLIGRRGGSTNRFFNGIIDDIRIYNRELTSDEIDALYNEGLCFETITVTDTLLINLNISGYNPVVYDNTIRIFPNPTSSQITINFGENYQSLDGYNLKIMNTANQTVYTSAINQEETTIELSTWTGVGIYFVHITDGLGNTVDIKKIVLQ